MEADRCTLEAVDSLPTRMGKNQGISIGQVTATLRQADQKLLLSDKDGGFVVASSDACDEKALQTVHAHFRRAEQAPKKIRNDAVKKCEDAGLTRLAASLKKAELCLQPFFSAKTHKAGIPFRLMITERGTWQRHIGRFLRTFLALLTIDDPSLVRSPAEVSGYLQPQSPTDVSAFSIDIKDLYFSLPHEALLDVVEEGIDNYGNVRFQNATGTAIGKFLGLLKFYFESSVVAFKGDYFVQDKGVCSGACLAPVLHDLLLARYDKKLAVSLVGNRTVRVF